jgi:stress response protein YsnF
MTVIDENGLQGVVIEGEASSPSIDNRLLVRFQNGQEVFVPSRMLIRHEDGRYYLPINIEALLAEQEVTGRHHLLDNATDDLTQEMLTQEMTDEQSLVFPVIKEKVEVQTRARESGVVEIRKTVNERTEVVDLPLQAEEVEVNRVAVNRFVDTPVPVRHEGNTMIISLLEEVLVVEKRLLLREEVHVKTVRKELHNPQEVLLREERVDVVRTPGPDQGEQQDGAH